MNEVEYLLVCLAEEAAEIQQAATKALRFGLDDSPPEASPPVAVPPSRQTNAQRIRYELTDLLAVAAMLVDRGSIEPGIDEEQGRLKKAKVERFMTYSRERGTLSRPAGPEGE